MQLGELWKLFLRPQRNGRREILAVGKDAGVSANSIRTWKVLGLGLGLALAYYCCCQHVLPLDSSPYHVPPCCSIHNVAFCLEVVNLSLQVSVT